MDKRNYVIMMYTDKESPFYGEPLRVDGYLESEYSEVILKNKIANWDNSKPKPVLIEDELIIKLFDVKHRREEYEITALEELRNELKRIAKDINMLVY